MAVCFWPVAEVARCPSGVVSCPRNTGTGVHLEWNLQLSQEQLAEAAGLHVNHISFIERAKTSASLQAIESIAKALNVKPSDLILSAEELLDQAP